MPSMVATIPMMRLSIIATSKARAHRHAEREQRREPRRRSSTEMLVELNAIRSARNRVTSRHCDHLRELVHRLLDLPRRRRAALTRPPTPEEER